MKNYIVTTSWDDGCRLDFKMMKLLEKYDLKGTFYISPYIEEGLKDIDIKKINISQEVGAHTLTHPDLTSISLKKARQEIEGSKIYLENIVNHPIKMFCYPKGRYNNNIKYLVKNYGFLGARTCNYGNFNQCKDPFEWLITLHASNGSPLMTKKIWIESGISIRSLLDWECRAKLLFDLFLKEGGIYHIWGHSWEIEKHKNWDKLENIFKYISRKSDVTYMCNGEALIKLFYI